MTAIKLTLPEPPSSNRYWRRRQGQHALYHSPEAKAYQQAVLAVWLRRPPAQRKALDGPLSLTFHWHRSAKRGDLSNRVKIVEDCLRGLAYADDGQIAELHGYRCESPRNGYLVVEISPLTNER